MTWILLITVLLGSAFLCLMMVRSAFADTVQNNVLVFDEYPEGIGDLNIFFISDIHRRSIRCSIIDQVKGKADIVIIGGDLTEKGVPFSRVKENLKKLVEVAPVYFIWGNNDYEVDVKKLTALFQEFGVTVLRNRAVFLPGFSNQITMIGTDFVDTSELIRPILYSLKNSAFRIVLSHNPAMASDMNVRDNVSLILSGHTHGGQIRIFGLGPYEKGGIKKYPWTTLLVSNGYGTSLLPLRLGAPAETHLITITKESSFDRRLHHEQSGSSFIV